MRCLSEALKETLASLSQDVPIAYVETEYFGGIGEQSATAYHLGVCILEPQTDVSGPISAALQMLGVQRGNHIDEFAAAGLDRFRNNEGWMEAAEE